MPNDINNLTDYIGPEGLPLIEPMERFFELLEKYNSKLNLVSKASLPKSAAKHFTDSYLGLKALESELNKESPIFDFGSGNGFPGIIAAMMFPDQNLILVEKDQRKSEFLKIATDHLELKNIEIHSGNVSELADGSCFQTISRAMAPLPKFLLEARQTTPPGGKAFLFKGDYWATEFGVIPAQVFEYWDVELMADYVLPADEGKRYIIRCSRIDS